MSKVKKSRSGVPAPGRQTENRQICKSNQLSNKYSIIHPAERQPFRITDILLHGAENAISRRELIAVTRYKDRTLRLLIEAEWRQGCPILSDNVHGYYLPGDQPERDSCVRGLLRRAKAIKAVANAIEHGGDVGTDD